MVTRINIQDEGNEQNKRSLAGVTERVYPEPALYKHGGYHGGHGGDVPRCNSDRNGSGNGRGT